jgi:hypothetical protein
MLSDVRVEFRTLPHRCAPLRTLPAVGPGSPVGEGGPGRHRGTAGVRTTARRKGSVAGPDDTPSERPVESSAALRAPEPLGSDRSNGRDVK